jgi:hypothetical protein
VKQVDDGEWLREGDTSAKVASDEDSWDATAATRQNQSLQYGLGVLPELIVMANRRSSSV